MIVRVTQRSQLQKERYGDTKYTDMEIQPEWLGPDGFAEFYADLGPALRSDLILDRIDNDVGYLRGNVRWATPSQSNANKSNTRWITVRGLTKTLSEWADDLGTSSTAVAQRIDILGWSEEEAVSAPCETKRPSNDLYYLQIAGRVAKRGTCLRRMVGCVLVDKHFRVISTSYNSVPVGVPNCTNSPCPGAASRSGEDLGACIAKHAEELALIKCRDVYEIFTCYSTTAPCVHCTRRLLDTSCSRIVFAEDYPHAESAVIWKNAGRTWLPFGSK